MVLSDTPLIIGWKPPTHPVSDALSPNSEIDFHPFFTMEAKNCKCCTSSAHAEREELVKSLIRNVPDFPKPGNSPLSTFSV